MVLVGYDNKKMGGAFKLMNSYGSDHGEHGFVYVPYEAFSELVV